MDNSSEIVEFKGWKGWVFDNPPKYQPMWFEKIQEEYWTDMFQNYWMLPFISGGIYLLAIFGLQSFMRNRKALQIRGTLLVWNLTIGLFSIIGFVRTFPELYGIVTSGPSGFFRSICTRDGINKPFTFWTLLFILSKHVELGDTVFIILRKRPLVLIQWYHHVITLIATWTAGIYVEPIGRWYTVMNYGVHSLMYPYFALRVLNVRLPAAVACSITTVQFAQMLMGLFVNVYSIYLINTGAQCDRHPNSIKLFVWIYGSFTFLFGNLFYESVIIKKLLRRRYVKFMDSNKSN